jgi:hypothetical protein
MDCDVQSKTARIYLRRGGFFPKLPKMRRRDEKLLESVFFVNLLKNEGWGGGMGNCWSCLSNCCWSSLNYTIVTFSNKCCLNVSDLALQIFRSQ